MQRKEEGGLPSVVFTECLLIPQPAQQSGARLSFGVVMIWACVLALTLRACRASENVCSFSGFLFPLLQNRDNIL